MTSSALKRRGREARTWMVDACFPLWSREGVAGYGLFREALDLTHRAIDSEDTRVRVQARQTYVFCLAAKLGWERERAERLVKMGVATLRGPARRADGRMRTQHADRSDGRARPPWLAPWLHGRPKMCTLRRTSRTGCRRWFTFQARFAFSPAFTKMCVLHMRVLRRKRRK